MSTVLDNPETEAASVVKPKEEKTFKVFMKYQKVCTPGRRKIWQRGLVSYIDHWVKFLEKVHTVFIRFFLKHLELMDKPLLLSLCRNIHLKKKRMKHCLELRSVSYTPDAVVFLIKILFFI